MARPGHSVFFLFYSLDINIEKAMAPYSGILAWKIPWTEKPGRLQSMGSQSRTLLSDFTFTFPFHALEKEMATHSSVLAWRIPGTGEPGWLLFMGSHRVGHDWSNLAAAAAAADINILCVSISMALLFMPTLFLPHTNLETMLIPDVRGQICFIDSQCFCGLCLSTLITLSSDLSIVFTTHILE